MLIKMDDIGFAQVVLAKNKQSLKPPPSHQLMGLIFEDSLHWFFPTPRLPPFRVLGSGVPFATSRDSNRCFARTKKVKHQPYP